MPKGRKEKKKSSEKQGENPENRRSGRLTRSNSNGGADNTDRNSPKTKEAKAAKAKSSPRKLNKRRAKGKTSCRGATARFMEDENEVIMSTSELENSEFPVDGDSQGGGPNHNDDARPEDEGGDESDLLASDDEDGELDDTSSSDQASESDSEEEEEVVVTPAKRPKSAEKEKVEDLQREIRRVNQAMEKMQRMMEKGEYSGGASRRSRSRRRSRSSTRSPRRRRRSRSARTRSRSRSRTPRRDRHSKGKRTKFFAPNLTVTSPSESTIYKQAVRPNLRGNTSAQEFDDSDNSSCEEQGIVGHGQRSNNVPLFPDTPRRGRESRERNRDNSQPRSRHESSGGRHGPPPPSRPTPEERAESMVREAEAAKIRMMDVAGRPNENNIERVARQGGGDHFSHTALLDENFLLVAAHVDQLLRGRIERGEYVDFGRLLPNDQVVAESDNRMQWVQENGETYLAPVGQRNRDRVSSFARWEQAFRVYSDIYTRAHPDRAAELIQYNHIISTASATYVWDNVYYYDCRFRIHMSHNPTRSWAIILQQAWTIYLKDRHKIEYGKSDRKMKREVCYRYNRGKCSYGSACKFDHRCGICGKHGHGSYNCRKIINDRNDSWDRKFDRRDGNDQGKGGRRDPPPPPAASSVGTAKAA